MDTPGINNEPFTLIFEEKWFKEIDINDMEAIIGKADVGGKLLYHLTYTGDDGVTVERSTKYRLVMVWYMLRYINKYLKELNNELSRSQSEN